ncbi:hypothetical protein [Ideonella sp. A 288]|uniref:hypothetical protein n=1 Tax=Ideonella sp. A 288 TaxID=1962181 RepID=UPI0011869F71|nr:hypothetical protein [Ideonella sp. A 288]
MSVAVRWAALSAALALCGCQSCPPYRAGWYLNDAPPAAPTVFLALLHEGQTPTTVKRVILNPGTEGASGWSLGLNRTLPTGGLLLLPASSFESDGGPFGICQLPVAVRIECTAGTRQFPVTGTLPNYLHDGWLQACSR